MKTAKVLLTNDDGVDSPGISAALDALHSIAEVMVVAPLHQQTAMGRAQAGDPQAVLLPKNMNVENVEIKAYACDASPAATVRHGLRVMHGYKPDLLVSGINYGENLGSNITSSGTVGAALEGACQGIPSIAISLETPIGCHYKYSQQNWETAMHFLKYFTQVVLDKGFPADVHILKIDVPAGATEKTPWRLTTLSPNMYYESCLESPSIKSKLSEAKTTKSGCLEEAPETDIYAIGIDKVISVTPLTLDFTSRGNFSDIHSWLTGAGTKGQNSFYLRGGAGFLLCQRKMVRLDLIPFCMIQIMLMS
jgi:5'-nucleotidase